MLPWPWALFISRTTGVGPGEHKIWKEAMPSCQLTRICSAQVEPALRLCALNCQRLHCSSGTSVLGTGWGCRPKVRSCHSCCDFCGCKLDRVKRRTRREEKKGKARWRKQGRPGKSTLWKVSSHDSKWEPETDIPQGLMFETHISSLRDSQSLMVLGTSQKQKMKIIF